MKSKSKYIVAPAYKSLFDFSSEEEKQAHEAAMVSARFLHEISRLCELHGWNKKELAKKLDVSPSFITQLYRGERLLNLTLIAKVQTVFKISFRLMLEKMDGYEGHEFADQVLKAIFDRQKKRSTSSKSEIILPKSKQHDSNLSYSTSTITDPYCA
ncbi:MAG: helix-turn-helix domain-containing protein [Bacteroidia bacterium]